MDLVIRGRSQDQRGARPRDTGRTRVEPDRTGPEGVGGPEWFQAGQDQRALEGRKSRVSRESHQLSAGVHQRAPEGRVAAAQSGHR